MDRALQCVSLVLVDGDVCLSARSRACLLCNVRGWCLCVAAERSLQRQSANWLMLSVSRSCAVCALNFAALEISDEYARGHLHCFGK